ncbi:MAG: hypothetical protein D6742_16055, partial [Cyanobacteria bacterium J069]
MPASGRFQSRLLSYLSRQRLRVGDRTARWLRQAADAVALGAQVVLYPVYVAFQSMRLVGRQMGPATQRMGLFLENVKRSVQGKPALPASPPPADAPIHKTLKAIRSAGLAVMLGKLLETHQDSRAIALRSAADLAPLRHIEDGRSLLTLPEEMGLTPAAASQLEPLVDQTLAGNAPAEIGGIASRLDSRHLVLVTTTNAVIDLSPQQQYWLRQQIIWELADYGRARRRWLKRSRLGLVGSRAAGALGSFTTDAALGELALQSPNPLSPSPADRLTRMLPVPMPREATMLPVKAFYQLMAWVQAGPVAIAANLFQEAALAIYFPPLESAVEAAAQFTADSIDMSRSAPALAGAVQFNPPNLRPKSPGKILLQLLTQPNAERLPESVPAGRVAPASAIAPSGTPADIMPDAHSV